MQGKLNGSTERFALALRDMVRDAAREAVRGEKSTGFKLTHYPLSL